VEIDKSIECYHELPYARVQANGKVDAGKIDLLYRTEKGWKLIDFKTDEIRDELKLNNMINEYRHQLGRYTAAVKALLNINPQVSLCFLDYNGTVEWVRLD
jgi:ATP-dependent exoDNAse (exonuclease V) beta subunit